jgi:hypothetical protein
MVVNTPPTSTRNRLVQWLAVAVCLVSGSTQELFPLSELVYWGNLIVLSCVAVFTLLRCLFTPVHVTLWDYFAGMIGMMYGLGTLNTAMSGITSFRDLAMLTSTPPIYLHTTMGYVTLLVAILLLLGLYSKTRILAGLTPESLNKAGILLFAVGTTLICLALVAIGSIGYHGDLVAEGSNTPNALATYAVICAAPAAASLIFMWRRYTGLARVIAATALLALFAVELYMGRRNVIYAVLICTIAHFASTRSASLISRQAITAIVAAACMMPIISTGFQAMRMASYETPAGQKPTVERIISSAIDIITHDKGEVDRQSAENLKERTFLVGYLAELAWHTDLRQPLHGRLFLYDFGMSIPRALWAEKFKYIRVGSEEGLAHPRLGMPSWDAANSVLTAGMTDFGPMGMTLYPIGVIAMFVLVLRFLQRLDAHIFFIISFILLNNLANIEGQMLVYFTVLRDAITVTIALYILLTGTKYFTSYNRPKDDITNNIEAHYRASAPSNA